jgi:hypothetical protein
VPSLFRRKPADLDEDAGADEEPTNASATEFRQRPKSYTPSKKELGVVTPKRKAGGRAPEPPPTNRREAVRRARQKQRETRAEARAGMMAGKEEYLLPRDKGPERRLVRDIVDSRRNLASYFLPAALVVIVGSSQAMPEPVRIGANIFWFALAFGVIADSLLLSRRVRRAVGERFPKSTGRHSWYAIMRSLSFRRMRMPAPQVKIGDKV